MNQAIQDLCQAVNNIEKALPHYCESTDKLLIYEATNILEERIIRIKAARQRILLRLDELNKDNPDYIPLADHTSTQS